MTRARPAPRATAALCAVLLAGAAGCAGQQDPGPSASPRKGPARTVPSAAAGTPSDPRGFTLVATGDVLPHASIIQQARLDAGGVGHDFRPMLAGVGPVVSRADIALCHMETVYGENGNYTGYPSFKSPPEIATALAGVGYDSCSTASNHTLDDGLAGVRRTLDALDRAGVGHAGSARTPQEADEPAWLTAGGAKVAQLAYTYGTNAEPLPEEESWAVDLIDEQRIVDDARAARSAGADVVVVSLHWGTEWQTDPDQQQLDLGRSLTASTTGGRPDIDLILGTHAHVPQAYEKVNGTWIVYGMGDQIAGDMINNEGVQDPRGNQGTIARFSFAPPVTRGGRWEVTKAEYIPQWMDTGAGRVVNLPEVLRREGPRGDRLEAQEAITSAVLSRGAAQDGLTMGR
ncbi:CapA family protein [Streptomyces pristinaespiralis]|uniref:Lipoprotein n=1 Tax=Streptomyces pristinaespiralis TaxID=38300 RepID=A0A0M3QH80_STRPR|nr:CapA family protein [Streptomyces pristinaespiralis]ALC19073.1 lipoprotein [Streptomyces pristinaespiralis]QMU17836.1 CapA family protein [Streptomyces pristinaespiralis]